MISRKTDYALRALYRLAGGEKGEWFATDKLGRELGISIVLLAKIFQLLSRRRIVETARGRGGGVRLIDRKASLGAVIRIMEPKFSLNKCLTGNFHCFLERKCPMHKILKQLDRELMKKLGGITILSLIKKEVKK